MFGALLALATLLVYQEVRHQYFVWDTIPYVIQNPWIHEWRIDNVIAMFTQAHEANWHPMVLLSHTLDIWLFGYNSGAHKLVNVLLHYGNALLLFFIMQTILTSNSMSDAESRWTAFLTALIFAIHPQHVESVAWVVERKDVLYSVFALSSLLAYLTTPDSAGWWRKVLPFGCFCLAVASKPMAITLPVVLLLLDVYPRRTIRDFKSAVGAVISKLPYFAVAALVAGVTLSTQSIAMPDAASLPLWARTLNAIDNTWFYIEHYAWPFSLSPFYPYPQDISFLISPAFWLPGTLFLTILTCLCSYLAFRHKVIWPGLLFAYYLVTLLPVSGLIHVGPAKATDHYVYLATIPLSLLTALMLVYLYRRFSGIRLVILSLAGTYLILLSSVAFLQTQIWHNSVALWTRVVQLHPDDPFGHRNLAAGYAEIEAWPLALHHAELSLTLGSPDRAYVEAMRRKAEDLDL